MLINGGEVASKEEWLSQLYQCRRERISPLRVFEIIKTNFDYRLVLGQSQDTIEPLAFGLANQRM